MLHLQGHVTDEHSTGTGMIPGMLPQCAAHDVLRTTHLASYLLYL